MLDHVKPDSQPKTTLSGIPAEMFNMITPKLNVNDQICLALSCKSMACIIVNDSRLACNSQDEAVRFETWRFAWLSNADARLTWQLRTNLLDMAMRERLAKELKMDHIERCKRKVYNDMMARLKVRKQARARIEIGGTEEAIVSQSTDGESAFDFDDQYMGMAL